jgi:hypothetical protein
MARVVTHNNDDEYVRSIVIKRLYYYYSDVIYFKHLFHTYTHIIAFSLNTIKRNETKEEEEKNAFDMCRIENQIKL